MASFEWLVEHRGIRTLRLRRSIPAPRLRAPPESLRSPHRGERFTAFALSGFDPPMHWVILLRVPQIAPPQGRSVLTG
jgi:hypothetical protein